MSLIGFSGAANAQQQVTDTNASSGKKILVVRLAVCFLGT